MRPAPLWRPAFTLEHFEHGDLFGREGIPLNRLTSDAWKIEASVVVASIDLLDGHFQSPSCPLGCARPTAFDLLAIWPAWIGLRRETLVGAANDRKLDSDLLKTTLIDRGWSRERAAKLVEQQAFAEALLAAAEAE